MFHRWDPGLHFLAIFLSDVTSVCFVSIDSTLIAAHWILWWHCLWVCPVVPQFQHIGSSDLRSGARLSLVCCICWVWGLLCYLRRSPTLCHVCSSFLACRVCCVEKLCLISRLARVSLSVSWVYLEYTSFTPGRMSSFRFFANLLLPWMFKCIPSFLNRASLMVWSARQKFASLLQKVTLSFLHNSSSCMLHIFIVSASPVLTLGHMLEIATWFHLLIYFAVIISVVISSITVSTSTPSSQSFPPATTVTLS